MDTRSDKVVIALDFMVPEILGEFNIDKKDVEFTAEIIIEIINYADEEKGVRNLKRAIIDIVSNINFYRILNGVSDGKYIICSKDVKRFVQINKKQEASMMYI